MYAFCVLDTVINLFYTATNENPGTEQSQNWHNINNNIVKPTLCAKSVRARLTDHMSCSYRNFFLSFCYSGSHAVQSRRGTRNLTFTRLKMRSYPSKKAPFGSFVVINSWMGSYPTKNPGFRTCYCTVPSWTLFCAFWQMQAINGSKFTSRQMHRYIKNIEGLGSL